MTDDAATIAGDDILIEIADRVAVITLNRPDRRNALNASLRRAIPAALLAVEDDDDVDVVILTGAGPAFCAGVDLNEVAAGSEASASFADSQPDDANRGPLPAHRKPLIGAINGPAVTGGFELALACDFLVASEHARFADTHARVGVMPGWGLTVLLPDAIGVRRAREMSITGNFIDSDLAFAWGLVNHVVPHDDLLPACIALAADITSNDQDGVRQMLDTYTQVTAATAEDAWAIEAKVSSDWVRDRFDPAAIERRRQDIVERGRAQQ
jgi:enoyl-CoA hydratase/carnithine racemase